MTATSKLLSNIVATSLLLCPVVSHAGQPWMGTVGLVGTFALGQVSNPVVPPSQRLSPAVERQARPIRRTENAPPSNELLEKIADKDTHFARKYLREGKHALAQGDIRTAIIWYRKALGTRPRLSANEFSVRNLGAQLQAAGVEIDRLTPIQARQALPPVMTPDEVARQGNAIPEAIAATFSESPESANRPPTDLATAKQHEQRLVKAAEMAIQRGDFASAEQLATQAYQLNIPDADSVHDTYRRPWTVIMDARRSASSYGAQATGSGPSTSPIQRVSYDQPLLNEPHPSDLQQPRVAQLDSSIDSPIDSNESAFQLFEQGKEALGNQDLDTARRSFELAWQRQDELDPATRDQLNANLQRLNAPGPFAGPTGPGQELSGDVQGQIARNLFSRVSREQAAANRQRSTDPLGAWERLKRLRTLVDESQVDGQTQAQLMSRVDRSLDEMQAFVERNRARIELDERNREVIQEVERRQKQKLQIQQKLAEYVEEFNALFDQQRFAEAVVTAKQAQDLDPQNPVVQNMLWKSKFARQFVSSLARRDDGQVGFVDTLGSVDGSSIPFDDSIGIKFPKAPEWAALSEERLKQLEDLSSRFGPAEMEIQQALKTQVDVNFENEALSDVIRELSRLAGINMYLDTSGIAMEAVTSDTPVTISLPNPVSLKSALNLILHPLRLGYVIQDEVLRITNEMERRGDVYTHTYKVADLVTPIPNFIPSYNMGLPGAIQQAYATQAAGLVGGVVNQGPLTVMNDSPTSGVNSTEASILAQMSATGMLPTGSPMSDRATYSPGGMGGGGPQADFDSLIDLITTTIEPESWEELGGQGSVKEFETNLSLVVSQTQEVHEKIVDLLRQLRRLQDLQVTIEVRFITITDNFFERIGVDFDFDVDDNTGLSVNEVLALDDEGPSVTVGIGNNGLPTADLDLQFTQGSFDTTIPTFGGFDPNSAANFGFAILSDIEAFFIIQAAQGDVRSNITQAPKVTLFDGQSASVSDQSSRPFVTSIIPVVGDFAAAHQPVITVLSEGTTLTVQAVVSPDRRFVRLTLIPFFSRIGDVDTFTFTGSSSSNTGTAVEDPTNENATIRDNAENSNVGTTVQLPTFAFTTVTTTVSVPDGGTILLGGIKRLSEGRTERGVPLLSKFPYINRLFKNVGIGREAESLMMMVTPRIIIQEEEEEAQTGFPPDR